MVVDVAKADEERSRMVSDHIHLKLKIVLGADASLVISLSLSNLIHYAYTNATAQ